VRDVPVAGNLMDNDLFGINVKLLVQALIIPTAPGFLLKFFGAPMAISLPLLLTGLLVGGFLFHATPPGQTPFEWTVAAITHYTTDSVAVLDLSTHWSNEVEVHNDRVGGEPVKEVTETLEQPSENGSKPVLDQVPLKDVRSDGILVKEDGGLVALVEVSPRPWLTADQETEEATYGAFKAFWSSVSFPVQLLTITSLFDAEKYLSRIENMEGDEEPNPLLRHGRRHHVKNLRNTIQRANIKDRHYFVAVAAQPSVAESSPMKALMEALGFGKTGDGAVEDTVEEVKSRANSVSSLLPRTGVETDLVSDADTALDILYRYYHGHPPGFQHRFTDDVVGGEQ